MKLSFLLLIDPFRPLLDRWGYSHQEANTVLALRPCGSLIWEISTSPARAGRVAPVLRQELALSLQHGEAYLTLYVVGMHRQFLAGLEVEVDNLKVGGIVGQEILEGLFPKAISLIEIDSFHEFSFFE